METFSLESLVKIVWPGVGFGLVSNTGYNKDEELF